MNQALFAYLPQDRQHALARGAALPSQMVGAALFADVSGFTPLTEVLAHTLGPRRGAEELLYHLNRVYDTLITQVDHYGGSVIGFSGDAITCWFDERQGPAVARATACAVAMQSAMAEFAQLTVAHDALLSIAVKVAVAAGAAQRFLVGDPTIQLLDVLAGETLTRMAQAENLATKGEILLDRAAVTDLGPAIQVLEWRADPVTQERFALVGALMSDVPPAPWPPLALEGLPPQTLQPWVIEAVYARLQLGQGEFLTELRPAVALFLGFQGLDYDNDSGAGAKLDAFIRWVQNIVAGYAGTLVDLTIGDKGSYLYIAWGAPVAHEDDDHRAVAAALALRAPPPELSFISAIKIGISRGTMRAGAYGGSTRRTYGILGDEVNLAARLMAHAAPNQVLVSGRVQSAAARHFVWHELPSIQVKGKRDPLPLWELVGVSGRQTFVLHEPAYELPLVGRERELALIGERLNLARQGRGQLLGITAEAGMGKSRLVAEAIRMSRTRGLVGYGGACQSYGTTTPYLVWRPLWQAFFGLDPEAAPELQIQTLEQVVGELAPALLPRLPLLGPVIELTIPDNEVTRSLDAAIRKSSREALLVDLVRARAQRQPLLFVLEDCHWIDPLSQDLLEALARVIDPLPIFLVLAYRPPEQQSFQANRIGGPDSVMALPYALELRLEHFTPEEASRLIRAKLAHALGGQSRGDHRADAMVSAITARAEGNPFYIEELLNYVYDQGIAPWDEAALAALEWPASLHSLVLSRIDQLSERQKIVIKVASIIGRVFRVDWLLGYYPAIGTPETLAAELAVLRKLDLTPLERPEPELAYLFKHIVTQEVAYASMSYATRTALHEQFARYLEAQASLTSMPPLDLLAYHYGRSENLPKKRTYLWRAAEAAQMAYANQAALAYYEQLLPLVENLREQVDILMALGSVLELIGAWEAADEHYRETLRLVTPTEEGSWAAFATVDVQRRLGSLLSRRGSMEEAISWLEQAQANATLLGQPARHHLSEVLLDLGVCRARQGAYAQAQSQVETALALARTLAMQETMAQAYYDLGAIAQDQGNYSVAAAFYEQSLALQRELGTKQGIAASLSSLGNVAYYQGDYPQAKALLADSLMLRREIGDKHGVAASLHNLGNMAASQGDYDTAKGLFEEGLVHHRDLGDKRGIAISLNNLGSIAYVQGDYQTASRVWLETLVLRRETGDKRGAAMALSNLGLVATEQGDFEGAGVLFQQSLALRREIGDKAGILNCLNYLGRVALSLQAPLEAQAHYSEALQLGQALGAKKLIAVSLIGLGATLLAGQPQAAQAATQLLAGAEALRAQIGAVMEPEVRPVFDQALHSARHLLGAPDFQAAWDQGHTMPLEALIALAHNPNTRPPRDEGKQK